MSKYETGYGSKTVLLNKQNNTNHWTLLAGNSYFISDCFISNQCQRKFERWGGEELSMQNLGFTCSMYMCTLRMYVCMYVRMYVCMRISVFQQRNYHWGRGSYECVWWCKKFFNMNLRCIFQSYIIIHSGPRSVKIHVYGLVLQQCRWIFT
jgi:hypothetical protein